MNEKKKFDRDKFSDVANMLIDLGKRNERGGSLPEVKKHTPEWNAWRSWRVQHGESVSFMDKREVYTVPSQWPPVSIEAMQADISSVKPSVKFQS